MLLTSVLHACVPVHALQLGILVEQAHNFLNFSGLMVHCTWLRNCKSKSGLESLALAPHAPWQDAQRTTLP